MHNNCDYIPAWKHWYLFRKSAGFLSFFLSLPSAFLHTFLSECDCIPLQCLYKGSVQSNEQLAVSRLLHNLYCGTAVFPYHGLDGRQAHETNGCAGLHNVGISRVFSINRALKQIDICLHLLRRYLNVRGPREKCLNYTMHSTAHLFLCSSYVTAGFEVFFHLHDSLEVHKSLCGVLILVLISYIWAVKFG
jgi:hypothetical protein